VAIVQVAAEAAIIIAATEVILRVIIKQETITDHPIITQMLAEVVLQGLLHHPGHLAVDHQAEVVDHLVVDAEDSVAVVMVAVVVVTDKIHNM
jgi:argininosuccinate synthase